MCVCVMPQEVFKMSLEQHLSCEVFFSNVLY